MKVQISISAAEVPKATKAQWDKMNSGEKKRYAAAYPNSKFVKAAMAKFEKKQGANKSLGFVIKDLDFAKSGTAKELKKAASELGPNAGVENIQMGPNDYLSADVKFKSKEQAIKWYKAYAPDSEEDEILEGIEPIKQK